MTTTTERTLADLSASLVAELTQSAVESDRRQRGTYVALASEFGVPAAEYVERAVGRTSAEQHLTTTRFMAEVLQIPAKATKSKISLSDEHRARIVGLFPQLEHELAKKRTIIREKLHGAVLERLRREAADRHTDGLIVLRSGVPRAQIQHATLRVKVMVVESNGGFVAKLADGDAIHEHGAAAISELEVDVGLNAFPPVEI